MNLNPTSLTRRAGLLTLAAAAVSIPVAAQAAKPPKPPGAKNQLKLSAPAPAIVIYGGAAVISGQLVGSGNGGQTVTLQQDIYPYGDGVSVAATTTTNPQGRFSFTRTPVKNTNFRIVVKGLSATTGLRVRPRVALRFSDSTPAAGQLVTFYGTVRPQHDGVRVLVQRRTTAGAFATLRRPVLQAATGNVSTYRTRLRVPSTGTYRTVIVGHGDHVTGYSPVRLIPTH